MNTKGNALKALKGKFLQDADYKVFIQNDKNPQGGRPREIYKLSVSCLEYFIAREIPEVFKVYREVFHRVRQEMQKPKELNLDEIIQVCNELKEARIKIALDVPYI